MPRTARWILPMALWFAPAAQAVDAAATVSAAPVPVLDTDFADPFVLPADGGLFAYATQTRRAGRRLNVQLSRSRDGRAWSAPVEAMPVPPRWASASDPSIWAPEAMRIGDRYVLYFSARHATRRRPDGLTLCIGAAVAKTPAGPYLPQPRPLTCGGEHGVIDASPFRDGDALWLHYKTDGNCCATPTTIVARRLRADGLALTGAPIPLRGIGNDRAWEGHVVEAPQMVRAHGRDWLFYAGNDYGGGSYATGYARCDGPAGPCRDAAENPILRTRPTGPSVIGPGHPSVFRHDGRMWIAYHGWRQARDRDGHDPDVHDRHARYRALYIDALDWVGGRPVVGAR